MKDLINVIHLFVVNMNSLTDLIWCASYRGLTVRCSIEDFQDIHTALFTHWTGIENIFSCFA